MAQDVDSEDEGPQRSRRRRQPSRRTAQPLEEGHPSPHLPPAQQEAGRVASGSQPGSTEQNGCSGQVKQESLGEEEEAAAASQAQVQACQAHAQSSRGAAPVAAAGPASVLGPAAVAAAGPSGPVGMEEEEDWVEVEDLELPSGALAQQWVHEDMLQASELLLAGVQPPSLEVCVFVWCGVCGGGGGGGWGCVWGGGVQEEGAEGRAAVAVHGLGGLRVLARQRRRAAPQSCRLLGEPLH